jgi:CelD/BcsL family acetyltransferase involved in cellulose biosynthesis
MIHISEVTTNLDFFNLRQEWNELILKAGSNTIFLTWEWLFNWWICFNSEKELKILLVREHKELIGIAPLLLCKCKRRTAYKIRFLGSTDVGSDYLDFILKKGKENEILNEIITYLILKENRWQIMDLTDIRCQSTSIGLMKKYFENSYDLLIQKYSTCPYIPLPDSPEIYFKSLSPNMRYNIRRKRRKFEQKYKGQFVVVKDKNEINKYFEEFIRLHLNRMKIKNINSPFTDGSFYEFHKNIISYFIDNDWLRLCFLKLNDVFIASFYIFNYGGKYYYYQSGFDPGWEKMSPGFLLFSYCIENAIMEDIKEFDFLQGSEAYKYQWTDRVRINLNVKLYRKNFTNKTLFIAEKYKPIVKTKIKKTVLNFNWFN